MLTLRRKEDLQESLHRHRAPQPHSQDAASCRSWFARPGYAGRGEPARKVGLDAAAEARRSDHGRQRAVGAEAASPADRRSEEHTSELQSLTNLVCRLLLEKK